ncbi:MAG: SdrD B-like domain-containing protein, partial [Pseudomonadota bacterium]
KLSEQLGLQANLTYDGARFSQGGALRQTPDFEGVLDDGLGSRFVGTVSSDWRSVKDWGPVRNVAAGVRSTYSRVGGSNGSDSVAGTAGFSAQITPLDLDISVDATVSRNSVADGEAQVANTVNVRAFKRFDWGRAQATYTTASVAAGGQSDNRFVGSLQVNPIRKVFPKGASVSAGPNASVVVAEGEVRSRFGATLSANSGRLFGQKLSLQGQATALQSIDPADTSTDFFASLAATYRFSRALQLETNYFDNFNGGRDVSIALRGRLVFNEPRKHTRPRDGLGVLRGKVFFDRNRDGIRQDDEPGIPSVRVQVSGTRLGLGVDRDGNFTIQNMKKGLYGLVVDRRSLPLGLLVPEESAARVTIGEGRITEIEIPIIASGQIRGALFLDTNGNGEADQGEQRLEGKFIKLTKLVEDGDAETEPEVGLSTTFGQYSFENLSPGRYEISVNHLGEVFSQTIELTEDGLFVVVPFALPVDRGVIAPDTFDAPVIGEA